MGDSISSVQGKDTRKGLFHRWTGIPFATVVSGQGTAYIERKKTLSRDASAMKTKLQQQLALQQDLQKQRDEIEQNIKDLRVVSGEAQTELAKLEQQRIEVEKRMDERRRYIYTPDARNAPEAIFWIFIGKIPVVGPVLSGIKTAGDIGGGVMKERNDRKKLGDINDETETWRGFQRATDSYASELQATANKLIERETADLNVIKTMQHAIAQKENAAKEM